MRLRCFAMVPLFFLAVGCSSTKVVETWKRPDYEAPRFQKIVVVGLARTAAERRAFESQVVSELQKRSYGAEPGSTFLPSKPLDVDQDELKEMVVSRGFDGALVLAVVSRDYRMKGGRIGQPDQSFGSLYFNFGSGIGRGREESRYRLVARLHDLSQPGLVWRAETKTVDPKNREKFAAEFARKIVGRMASDGVLQR